MPIKEAWKLIIQFKQALNFINNNMTQCLSYFKQGFFNIKQLI